jgi:tRNA-splicing ligase RtcB (3'-phosphate/5'-hydroxy nucleic acid ligase)
MELAGEYAYAGRDVVVAKVLEILGAEPVYEVHNHHNFAWREEHGGRTYWVIRKGCTPARPAQEGFVGGSMGDESVILEGVASAEAEASLFSTVHGAGRIMSRTQAAGKIRRRKRWQCTNRDCERVFELEGISADRPAPKRGVCPDHPDASARKVWTEEQVKAGKVDWRPSRHACASRGSCSSAAVLMRRRRCTSASQTCSMHMPVRSASSTL